MRRGIRTAAGLGRKAATGEGVHAFGSLVSDVHVSPSDNLSPGTSKAQSRCKDFHLFLMSIS